MYKDDTNCWVFKSITYIRSYFHRFISRIPLRHRKFIFMSSAVFCISLLAIGTIFFAYDKIIDRSYVLSKNMQQVIGISNPTPIYP